MNAVYVSANSFKVLGDKTSEFNEGRRVKLDCDPDGIKYAVIISSSYSSPYTTVVIDESTLTTNLDSVLYGVVQPGSVGSLPDHLHDGSEGSGGTISGTGSGFAAQTFLELTDTPSTYDNEKYLRSTVSGTEWSTISGSGNYLEQDGSTQLTGDWNYGSNSISGTGDIHCNDIYTASGTVYIGDLKLSTDGTNLLVDDSQIDVDKTLLELTDTPSSYSEGLYLKSTVDGTEWATASGGGGGSSDFLDLNDTPDYYPPSTISGSAGHFVTATNSGIDYMELYSYGSNDPPTASGLPNGFLYFKYTV